MRNRVLTVLCVKAILFAIVSCSNSPKDANNEIGRIDTLGESIRYTSFRDVPGVTEDEIKAIEAFARQERSFVYGMLQSTEAFRDENGELRGFAALFCAWLSELFEIRFETKLYERGDLLRDLKSGAVDFTGELTASDERRKSYFMTDAIAHRSVIDIRLTDGEAAPEIVKRRPVRYGFLSGSATIADVAAQTPYRFTSVFVHNYADAYALLKRGTIDAFVEEWTAEEAFDAYDDISIENFYPILYHSVSLATQNPANRHIISVVQKILQNGGDRYLTELYNMGEVEYLRHRLFEQLNDEERFYLKHAPVITYAGESKNYPISFYNVHDKEYQGISIDALADVAKLTGLRFERSNTQIADRADLLTMLESGEVSMLSELIFTEDRKDRFLWPKAALMTDNYALLSKTKHRDIHLSEIFYMRVGIVEEDVHNEVFLKWFPDHKTTIKYANFDEVFAALDKNEIDMVMSSKNLLLWQTSFREHPDYKANIVFNYSYRSTFGFNLKESILCSIVDKALSIIDTEIIADRWTHKTYDYLVETAKMKTLYVIIIAAALLSAAAFVLVMWRRVARKRAKLHSAFMEMMAECVEGRDSTTGGHIRRTRTFLNILIDEILLQGRYKNQMRTWNVDTLLMSAQLHDIGKISIEDSILRKPGKLTTDEFEIIKTHTTSGGKLIEQMQSKSSEAKFLEYAKIFALHHHEKWDGSGYPRGISGDDIPLPARMMALVDVYDALISERPYKPAYSHETAVKIIEEGKGKHFDPALTELFISISERFRSST